MGAQNNMRMNKLGNSDLIVSAVGAGTWAMGGDFFGAIEDKKCIDSLCASLDHGVNLIDTAPIYGKGHSEQLVGQAIKGRRDKVVLCTKVGLIFGDPKGRQGNCLQADAIEWEIEQSLRRLGTDYIDLYQMHWPDVNTPIEESMEALLKIQKAGKIRYIGVSNFDVPLLECTLKCGQIVSTQPQYSLLDRDIEKDVLPFCREKNLGVLSYGSLGAGILTGKFKEPPKPAEGDKRANFYPFFAEPFFGKTQELLVTLREIAEAHDKPIAHVAINWVSQQPGMTCALTGSKNVDQAVMNAAAGDWDLTAEELKKIDDAYDRIFRA